MPQCPKYNLELLLVKKNIFVTGDFVCKGEAFEKLQWP